MPSGLRRSRTGTPTTRSIGCRHDGAYRWFKARGVAIREGDGGVVHWFGTCTDIDDQKRAEEALRASERIYRAIGESIPFGVWICDPDGHNTYVSESFLRLVGLTQEQCSQFGWGDVLHPGDAARTIEAWKECVRVEGKWDIEHRVRGTDGQYHPILARGIPVRDEEGRIVCWAGINLDISRLKAAEPRCGGARSAIAAPSPPPDSPTGSGKSRPTASPTRTRSRSSTAGPMTGRLPISRSTSPSSTPRTETPSAAPPSGP